MDTNVIRLPVQFVDEVAATKSVIEIPQVVARWFKSMFHADRASFTLADGKTHLRLLALEGNQAIPRDMPVPIEGTMVGRVYRTRVAEFCNDLTASTDLDCKMLAQHGILSCLDAPLSSGEHCYGTINIGRAQLDAFDQKTKEQLEAMARLIGSVMHAHWQAEQLREAAERDPLTGALNRRAFSKFMDAGQKSGDAKGFGVALIDLDHFKNINDSFGHDTGDKVLIHVSQLLHVVCRKGDLVARFGGEEFFIAVNETETASFRALLLRLLETLRSTPLHTGHGPVSVTASIGAICVDQHPESFDELYAKVDKALYRAKNLGRDRVEFAHSGD